MPQLIQAARRLSLYQGHLILLDFSGTPLTWDDSGRYCRLREEGNQGASRQSWCTLLQSWRWCPPAVGNGRVADWEGDMPGDPCAFNGFAPADSTAGAPQHESTASAGSALPEAAAWAPPLLCLMLGNNRRVPLPTSHGLCRAECAVPKTHAALWRLACSC